MGIFKRVSRVVKSNMNAPDYKKSEKELEKFFKSIEDEIGKIKAEKAKVETEKARVKRELDECKSEINKLEKYIDRARQAQEDEAVFIQKKEILEEKLVKLERKYNEISNQELLMRQTHDALLDQINDLKTRKEIDIKLEKAKFQNKINDLNSSSFSDIEEKANRLLDEAEAMAELNEFERGNI